MAHAQPRVVPVLNGDEARYRRRYRALKDMVNDLSDESNLLALRVHQIQRRIYDRHMAEFGRPPPQVPVPEDATWAPLVQNATHYARNTGAPPAPADSGAAAEISSPAVASPVYDDGAGTPEVAEVQEPQLSRRAPASRGSGRGSRGGRRERTSAVHEREREREREKRERVRERAREREAREARAQYDDDDDDDDDEEEEEERHDHREPLPSSPVPDRQVDREIEDMMDDY